MKKILIALVSVALLAGCSADGVFNGGTLENPNVTWSNNDDPSADYVYCSIQGICTYMLQAVCAAGNGTVVSSCPSNPGPTTSMYCYYLLGGIYYCDAIPKYFSQPECVSAYGSAAVIDRQTCISRGADIWD